MWAGFKKLDYKVRSTAVFAIIFEVPLFFFAYQIDKVNYPVTYIICLSGGVLGWLIGIFSSPHSNKESEQFRKLSSIIGTFLSGYILSKFDKVFDPQYLKLSFDTLIGIRIALFLCFLGITWIVVFVSRYYAKLD